MRNADLRSRSQCDVQVQLLSVDTDVPLGTPVS